MWILKVIHFTLIMVYVIKIIISERDYMFDEYAAKEEKEIPRNILKRIYLLMKLVFHSTKFK